MEKKYIFIQVSPSIIWNKYATIIKLANKKDWGKIMDKCSDIPANVVLSLPYPIQKVIKTYRSDLEDSDESDEVISSNTNQQHHNNIPNQQNQPNISNQQQINRLEITSF